MLCVCVCSSVTCSFKYSVYRCIIFGIYRIYIYVVVSIYLLIYSVLGSWQKRYLGCRVFCVKNLVGNNQRPSVWRRRWCRICMSYDSVSMRTTGIHFGRSAKKRSSQLYADYAQNAFVNCTRHLHCWFTIRMLYSIVYRNENRWPRITRTYCILILRTHTRTHRTHIIM